ncbi:MAG: lipid-A-disaccharide synthase N-terminal domain-containing protein [Proteobacteria bacterium]|nr:lipid-A-disaccharide synthase N-terminal domain-containing protein [Pseudomonadota bacterium]
MTQFTIWLVIGFLGQVLFGMRFVVQWIRSEREGRSIIPVAFWYFSVAGGVTLLSYALWRQDPVFIVGQAGGLLIYGRNLFFIRRDRRRAATPGS